MMGSGARWARSGLVFRFCRPTRRPRWSAIRRNLYRYSQVGR